MLLLYFPLCLLLLTWAPELARSDWSDELIGNAQRATGNGRSLSSSSASDVKDCSTYLQQQLSALLNSTSIPDDLGVELSRILSASPGPCLSHNVEDDCGLSSSKLAAAIAVPICGCAAIVAILWFFAARSYQLPWRSCVGAGSEDIEAARVPEKDKDASLLRSLSGRMAKANASIDMIHRAGPGVGPNTTLVMTDVQNSTVLWEMLPTYIMDDAMAVHDNLIYTEIIKHKGYSSATEGDAFIVAFDFPTEALRFSLAVQTGLLNAAWPTQLLENPNGRSVYVSTPPPKTPNPFMPDEDDGIDGASVLPMLPAAFRSNSFINVCQSAQSFISNFGRQISGNLPTPVRPRSWKNAPPASRPSATAGQQPNLIRRSKLASAPLHQIVGGSKKSIDLHDSTAETHSRGGCSEPVPHPRLFERSNNRAYIPPHTNTKKTGSFQERRRRKTSETGPAFGSGSRSALPPEFQEYQLPCLLPAPAAAAAAAAGSRDSGSSSLHSTLMEPVRKSKNFERQTPRSPLATSSLSLPQSPPSSTHSNCLCRSDDLSCMRKKSDLNRSFTTVASVMPAHLSRSITPGYQRRSEDPGVPWAQRLSLKLLKGRLEKRDRQIPASSSISNGYSQESGDSAQSQEPLFSGESAPGSQPVHGHSSMGTLSLVGQSRIDNGGPVTPKFCVASSSLLYSSGGVQGSKCTEQVVTRAGDVQSRRCAEQGMYRSGNGNQAQAHNDGFNSSPGYQGSEVQTPTASLHAAQSVDSTVVSEGQGYCTHDPDSNDLVQQPPLSSSPKTPESSNMFDPGPGTMFGPGPSPSPGPGPSTRIYDRSGSDQAKALPPGPVAESHHHTIHDLPHFRVSESSPSDVLPAGSGGRASLYDVLLGMGVEGEGASSDCAQSLDGGEDRVHLFSTWMAQLASKYRKRRHSRTATDIALIFSGLRVRIGMHCGISDPADISYDSVRECTSYSGHCMDMTRAVADSCPGGAITLTKQAFHKCDMLRLSKEEEPVKRPFIIYAGDFLLDGIDAVVQCREPLYLAVPHSLKSRMPHIQDIRNAKQVSMGTPSAPVGTVTVAFMYVIGAAQLLKDMPEIARSAINAFQDISFSQLYQHGGYKINVLDGLIVAAFAHPADGVSWGISVREDLAQHEWPSEILNHRLCRPEKSMRQKTEPQPLLDAITTRSPAFSARRESFRRQGGQVDSFRRRSGKEGGSPSGNNSPGQDFQDRIVELNGIRIKVGVDMGPVACTVTSTSGELFYRGKVMNRAARIATKASPGRVVCSSVAWDHIQHNETSKKKGLRAVSIGEFELKGIMGTMVLLDCYRSQVKSRRFSSAVEVSLELPMVALTGIDTNANSQSGATRAPRGWESSHKPNSRGRGMFLPGGEESSHKANSRGNVMWLPQEESSDFGRVMLASSYVTLSSAGAGPSYLVEKDAVRAQTLQKPPPSAISTAWI